MVTLKAKHNKTSEERALSEISPGPAKYTPLTTFGRDITPISLVGKPKWRPLNINPGPGQYAPSYTTQTPRALF